MEGEKTAVENDYFVLKKDNSKLNSSIKKLQIERAEKERDIATLQDAASKLSSDYNAQAEIASLLQEDAESLRENTSTLKRDLLEKTRELDNRNDYYQSLEEKFEKEAKSYLSNLARVKDTSQIELDTKNHAYNLLKDTVIKEFALSPKEFKSMVERQKHPQLAQPSKGGVFQQYIDSHPEKFSDKK